MEVKSGKFSTREGSLLVELTPTPKIISELRDWFPNASLVGWKYEVDGSCDDVIEKARRQIAECRTNACVANGPVYGIGFGLVSPEKPVRRYRDACGLFESLVELLAASIRTRKH